ncbi:putative toxin-antitoxin system toxin component, PIN family [Candidatus Woesearchaeota archaeon]|nr:putative toxin-antitoxin system toxin component, PIN family [Candidatus Woesearchaeota archaeon]
MGKGKAKVVIDTNVLISAIGWKGRPDELIKKAIDGEVIWFISPELIKEVMEVLEYPKLKFTEAQRRRGTEIIQKNACVIVPDMQLSLADDPDDNRVLECAQAAQADWIITGDQKLLRLKRMGKTNICSIETFLKNLNNI